MSVALSLGRVGTEAVVVIAKFLSAIGIREHFTTQCLAYNTLYIIDVKALSAKQTQTQTHTRTHTAHF